MEVASQHWTDWTDWTLKAKCRIGWDWIGWMGYPILLLHQSDANKKKKTSLRPKNTLDAERPPPLNEKVAKIYQ